MKGALMLKIGDRIRKARLAKGWSQKMLGASAGGRDVTQINGYECGRSKPSMPVLKDIAAALNVSVADLTGESEVASPSPLTPIDDLETLVREFKKKFSDIAQVDASRVTVQVSYP